MTFSVLLRGRKKPVRKGNASTHTFLSRKKRGKEGKWTFFFFSFSVLIPDLLFRMRKANPATLPLPPTPRENFYYVLLRLSLLYTPTLAHVLRKGGLEELDRASRREKEVGKEGECLFFTYRGQREREKGKGVWRNCEKRKGMRRVCEILSCPLVGSGYVWDVPCTLCSKPTMLPT